MMMDIVQEKETILTGLTSAVAEAVAFFEAADESLCDGYQSAYEVLAHLVFWHEEYGRVTAALVNGQTPQLKEGSYARLNALAAEIFCKTPLPLLAQRLAQAQRKLERNLRRLPSWDVYLPVKRGGRFRTVWQRVPQFEAHIRHHVSRLQRAQRHGDAWVQAYFGEALRTARSGQAWSAERVELEVA
jgi:hypothetical protein